MSHPFQNIEGTTGWRAPSNIALIKYWGKYGRQLPRNASVSYTLSKAYTETTVGYKSIENSNSISLKFLFEGNEQPKFEQKIRNFLESVTEFFPFLQHLHLEINSHNSFPHSTGIASSASSMAALALCLTDIECTLGSEMLPAQFYEKASTIARLGSGSACRSVFPYAAEWGKHPLLPASSDEYALPFELAPVFQSFKDAILIVSSKEKSVSSRAGHSLMEGNPFAPSRYAQAESNMSFLIEHLRSGNVQEFGYIIENEALTLHALMMCSTPSYMLMLPNTLKIIDLIRSYRQKKGVPLFFTLDAGPNVHLLYPAEYATEVEDFIRNGLLIYCEDGKVLYDEVGKGPQKIS